MAVQAWVRVLRDYQGAVRYARNGDAIHKLQRRVRLRNSAAEPVDEPGTPGGPAHHRALLQHHRVFTGAAVYARQRLAQSGAWAGISGCRPDDRQTFSFCRALHGRTARRSLQREQHARARPAQWQFRVGGVRLDHFRRRSSLLRIRCEDQVLRYLALAALLLTSCTRRSPATLTVAAASDLQFAMQEITEPFRAAHRELDLRIVYGSSGNFFTQIRNGAPFDVYLSADMQYPRQLTAAPGDVFRYAVGRIVLWTPPGSPLDPATALQDVRLQRLAIANPAHAPYG